MLKERIFNFYKNSSQVERIKGYSGLKLYFLYPMTVMNKNVLDVLTSIATCLSMNIFTNFMSFQEDSFFELVVWILRFTNAIIFNICLVKLTIICAIIKEKAKAKEAKLEYLHSLVESYEDNYEKIQNLIVVGMISFIFLCILIIVLPIGKYIYKQLVHI